MGLINTAIGALALLVSCSVIWGFIFVLQVVTKSLGRDDSLYVLSAVPLLIFSYLLGEGIHALRKEHRKLH